MVTAAYFTPHMDQGACPTCPFVARDRGARWICRSIRANSCSTQRNRVANPTAIRTSKKAQLFELGCAPSCLCRTAVGLLATRHLLETLVLTSRLSPNNLRPKPITISCNIPTREAALVSRSLRLHTILTRLAIRTVIFLAARTEPPSSTCLLGRITCLR